MIDIQSTPRGIIFWAHIQPRASRAAIIGAHQNALKIKLTAPPVAGAANKQCIDLLAKALSRPKSTITIISGETSRRKQICLGPKTATMEPAEAAALKTRLEQLARESLMHGQARPKTHKPPH